MRIPRIICLVVILISLSVTLQFCRKKDVGNADITTRTFSVSSWTWRSPDYYTDLSVPELTSDNINVAGVMVYFSRSSNNWIAVPYTQYNSPYNYVMNFSSAPGTIEVSWFYDTGLFQGSDPNAYYNTTVQIKVVVIPPADRIKYPDVDYKNYNEVKKAFNLND
jgi:hypothetical protein